VGYSLFGAVTRRLVARPEAAGQPARLLLVCRPSEAGIGAYALLFAAFFSLVQRLSHAPPVRSSGTSGARTAVLPTATGLGPPGLTRSRQLAHGARIPL
jgi:hypothetical protein